MTGRQVLLAAADLPLTDDPGTWSPWHLGHGLVRALKEAAGLGEGPWDEAAVSAYYEAYEPLEELCARLKSPGVGPYGTIDRGPVKFWAEHNPSEEARKELLLTMARGMRP